MLFCRNYRSKKAIEMAELTLVESDALDADAKQQLDVPIAKTPASKRAPTLSAAGAKSVAANKKGFVLSSSSDDILI